jgi:hypothetical protein
MRTQRKGAFSSNQEGELEVQSACAHQFESVVAGFLPPHPQPLSPEDGGEGGSESPPRQNVRLLFAFCSHNFYIFL